MIRLSIIVPVYNVEQWLQRCILSLLAIDIPKANYEIIIVNDGSTDGSLKIAEEIASIYSNIRIISQPNAGLSGARNTGIEVARGDYIWFVDSDDYVEPDMVKTVLDAAIAGRCDILCFALQLAWEDGRTEVYAVTDKTNGEIVDGGRFICNVTMPPAAWCAFYRREFVMENGLLFMEGIYHEDQEFTPRAYLLAKKIQYRSIVVYNYFQREGSIMKDPSKAKKKCFDLLKVADSLYDFTRIQTEDGTGARDEMMNHVYFCMGQSLKYAKLDDIDIYKGKPYYPIKLNSRMDCKTKIKYTLMDISLKMYILLHNTAKLR